MHPQRVRVLPQRFLCAQAFGLDHGDGDRPGLEQQLDPLFAGDQAKFVQTDHCRPGPVLVGEFGERASVPQRFGLVDAVERGAAAALQRVEDQPVRSASRRWRRGEAEERNPVAW